jgi:hypothetical protein
MQTAHVAVKVGEADSAGVCCMRLLLLQVVSAITREFDLVTSWNPG